MSYNIVTLIFCSFSALRRIFLSTKFINGEGFDKIETLKSNKKREKFNNKFLRFLGRIPTEISRDAAHIRKKFKNITWETLTLKKFFKGIRKLCLPTSTFKQLTTPRGIFNLAVPILAFGLFVFTVCFWTTGDYSLKVTYNDKYIGTISDDSVLTEATAQIHSALSSADSHYKTVTPTMQFSTPFDNDSKSSASEVYLKLADCNNGIIKDACGLYIDDVFMGSTTDHETLNTLLTSYLDSAKEGYGGTTTVSFKNNVQLKRGVYALNTLVNVNELFERAKTSFSVRVETDFVVKSDKVFKTVYKYDENQPDTYRKVVQKGKEGVQEIFYRMAYVDGKPAEFIVKSSTTLEEPVDRIVVVGTMETNSGTGTFAWPVPAANNISSLFEYRWGSFHAGLDIADVGIYRADIIASDSGIVTYSDYDDSGYGYTIMIDHGNGYMTMYAHCDELYVPEGTVVNQGDVIAAVGSTGYSTGDHLHFEIWEDGVPVDPCEYMNYSGYTVIYY